MNQFQGHWFMSNALITCINLTQTMEVEMGWVVDVTNVLNPFDFEVFLFLKMGFRLLRWSKHVFVSWYFMICINSITCLPLCLILVSSLYKFWKIMWDGGMLSILLLSMMQK
jgi:hypothetical protein